MPSVEVADPSHYFDLIRSAQSHFRRTPDETWLKCFDAEQASLFRAFHKMEGLDSVEYAVGMWRWMLERGLAGQFIDLIFSTPFDSKETPFTFQMECCLALGVSFQRLNDFDNANYFLELAWEIASFVTTPFDRALILHYKGVLLRRQNNIIGAEQCNDQAMELWRTNDDKWGIATAYNEKGILAWLQKDLDNACTFLSMSAGLFTQINDLRQSAKILNNLGIMTGERCQYKQAFLIYNRCVALFRQLGDTTSLAISLYNQGEVSREMKAFSKATGLLTESFDLMQRNGYTKFVPYVTISLGMVAHSLNDSKRACTLLGAAQSQCRKYGVELPDVIQAPLTVCEHEIRTNLNAQVRSSAYRRGRNMTLEEVAAFIHAPASF